MGYLYKKKIVNKYWMLKVEQRFCYHFIFQISLKKYQFKRKQPPISNSHQTKRRQHRQIPLALVLVWVSIKWIISALTTCLPQLLFLAASEELIAVETKITQIFYLLNSLLFRCQANGTTHKRLQFRFSVAKCSTVGWHRAKYLNRR